MRAAPDRRGARAIVAVVAVVAVVAAALVVTVPATSATPAVVVDHTCTSSGQQVPSGSGLISTPMLPQITGSSLPVAVPVTLDTTAQINPGGTVTSTAAFSLDVSAVAQAVLVDRVRPGVVAAGYPDLAPSAWVSLGLDDLRVSLVLPPDVLPVGSPTASSPDAPATATFTGTGVELRLGAVGTDTRDPRAPLHFAVSWVATDTGAPAPRELVVHPGPASFTARVDVGLLFFGSPVVGGVRGPWTCTPVQPATVLGRTEVVSDPVPTTAPTTTGSTTPATTAPTTTAPSPPTTVPAATRIPPGACAVGGFDGYGGTTAVQLEATGYFRTARFRGRWALVDPDGHLFFSQGINHVTYAGTPDQFGADPYHQAAAARYGTQARWADAQVQRMHDWGYNTLGAWSDTAGFEAKEPYTVLLDLTAQDFGTGVMEDLWASSWEAGVQQAAATRVAPLRDDPFLLGYWTDNELHWGPDWRPVHLFDEYLRRPASAPGKQALLAFLHARYATFADFAADVTTSATSWTDLEGPTTATTWTASGGQATRDAWVGEVAERYFSVTSDALRAADPHHLLLGPRMMAQVTGTPVLQAAARHLDVASFNDYRIVPELELPLRNADPTYLPVDRGLAAQAAVLDKPIIVSEWSFRAADSGLPNTWPPLFPTLATQDERAAAYEAFTTSLLDTTWIVGQHWFEHSDEPPAGRPGGENSNFGLVDLADDPYPPMIAVSRTMHDCAYARLLAADAIGPTTPPTTPTTTVPAAAGPAATGSPTATDPAGPTPGTGSAGPAPVAPSVRAAPAYTG